MHDPAEVRRLMPLMREFGDLARKRVGAGVTPLEFQRFLDLKGQIGQKFVRQGELRASGDKDRSGRPALTRLRVRFPTRADLISSIVDNIKPAGLLITTPFAAEVGTRFLLKLTLEREGEAAEFPTIVVTSISQSAHTLSTTSMGMGLKIEKMSPAQAAGLAKIFDHALDRQLGWLD